MGKLLDHDKFSGITTIHHYDESTDETTLEYVQDVEAILDFNKGLQNNEQYSKDGIKNEMWHYAKIPSIIQMKWMTELGVNIYDKNHQKRVLQLLNSAEYKYLRTTTGRHA